MKGGLHAPEKKPRVGVLDTTGVVGQRFLTILEQHPRFEVTASTTNPQNASKTHEEAVGDRWKFDIPMSERYKKMAIRNMNEVEQMAREVDSVSSAVDMTRGEIRAIEDVYAKYETPIALNSSVHRWTPDIPTITPGANPEHLEIIAAQRKRLGAGRGFVVVKPNCSIQSYTPVFAAQRELEPHEATVTTYQATSGTGKNLKDWSGMVGNIIPYIGGEEEKSEKEPLHIYGHIEDDHIEPATEPKISSQCIRVPVLDGYTAAAFMKFRKKPTKEQLLEKLATFNGLSQEMELPSTPQQPTRYMEEENRSQVALDVNYEGGMGISIGRFREDTIYDQRFVNLSHNALRGTAGGATGCAEALTALGYIVAK